MGIGRKINLQHFIFDLVVVIASTYLSLLLRLNGDEFQSFLPHLNRIIPIVIAARAVSFMYFETYNIIWRYVSAFDAFRLAKAITLSTAMIIAITYLFDLGKIPRSVYFIDAFLVLFMLCGARLTRRLIHEAQSKKILEDNGEKTLIYGAGMTGQGLLRRLSVNEQLKLFVVGFIDDDPLKIGRTISGINVLGDLDKLESVIRNYEIKQVVIAIPRISKDALGKVLAVCSEHSIKPQILNSELGTGSGEPIRNLELKDLLRRSPHAIDITSTMQMIKGKRVLITGAGGSIGSEIARQVLSLEPSRLVVLDHSEFVLYGIDQELRQRETYEQIVVPALVDIKDKKTLENVFSSYKPEIVFHAAAYKHVHLVESNPYASILNNVMGTKNLLELSEKYATENFVLISTDKAVNPAGLMGATKRICEIMTTLTGERMQKRFCAVRFGNVLGSSGSLIPLLKSQIENGQPLTITHKDVTRYFMLIDEAVSLVLKAASIAKSGDINVLKMGDPIKIIDIAKSLIVLMGKSQDEVKIKFTGLRPGEKMFEELYISGKELNTEHPDILVMPKGDAVSANVNVATFDGQIEKIITAAKEAQPESVSLLNGIVNSNYKVQALEQEA